ncbi:MAG: diguanylate cyclase, partial [Rhodocyclaceae bacterium]|nr:diguanylate cyclase [Rhodocyclaceae bacterium]
PPPPPPPPRVMKGGRLLGTLNHHPRWLAALSAVVLAVTSLGGYLWGREIALVEVEERLDERAHAVTDHMDSVLGHYRSGLFIIGHTTSAMKLLGNAKPEPGRDWEAVTNAFLERLAAPLGAEAIYVMNLDGRVVAASNYRAPVSFLGKNYGFRAYFRQALAQGASDYVARGVTSKVPGYYSSHAVRIDGEVRGVIVAKASLDTIEAKLDWHNGHSILIADPRGVVLMPRNQRFQTLRPLTPAERQAIAAEKQYEGEALPPLALTRLGKVKGMTCVRFAAASDRTLFEKAYPLPGLGQLHLYEDSARYTTRLWSHVALGFMAGLAAVLLVHLAMQRWLIRETLLQAAIHDPLTGLYTRLYMNGVLPHLCAAHDRDPDRTFAVAMFDLDHFKQINDTHGHLTGDAVLRGVGEILRRYGRGSDFTMRFGGEELMLAIAPCPDVAGAVAVAERIRQAVAEARFQYAGKTVCITLSAGIAMHQAGETVDTLIGRADEKLYQAKQTGRNRVCS